MSAVLGFGEGGFGDGPFGDEEVEAFYNALPVELPFDIYCAHDEDALNLLLFPEVTYVGEVLSVFQNLVNGSLTITSGGGFSTNNARLEIDTQVPGVFTLDASFILDILPTNFANLQDRHCFIGVFDAAGSAAGFFISEIGLLYTGVVHFSGQDVVLDQAIQPLPNSQALIELGVPYSLRVSVSHDLRTTYIFWTRTSDVEALGHQLRYVIPSFSVAESLTPTTDRTMYSVRGTGAAPVQFGLLSSCLGTGLLIPNLRPVADAGSDQAVRSCAIVQFDGSRSFDPEAAFITYKWRLVDAPLNSMFAIESLDALTYPEAVPSGFTDHIYSSDLELAHIDDPIEVGDVVLLAGETYEVASFGSDGNGFFVDVGDDIVPDSFSTGQAFKLLRQRGMSNVTEINPTFLPDVPGLFKFDLVVYDGGLYSEPAITVVNVTASPLPRGIIPDLKFLWDYLGDFWRLVEDRERIEVFWSAFAQVAASESLTFWQTDYNKSLRDVQRTFQRRWLHYDLLMREPPQFLELSTLRTVYGGIESDDIVVADGLIVEGLTLELFVPFQAESVPIYFSAAGIQTSLQVATRINAVCQVLSLDITALVITDRDGIHEKIRLDAPFGVSVSGSSTLTIFGVRENTYPSGSAGTVLGARAYRVNRSLSRLDILEGDFLVVGTGTYRIARVVDDVNDPLLYQRIVLYDDIPLDAGAFWLISGKTTSQSLDFYDGLFTSGDVATLEVIDLTTGALSYASVAVTGACATEPNSLGIDTTQLGQYVHLPEQYAVYFFSAKRRQYTPVDDLVSDVPYLQELIKNTDDTLVLRRNVDFFIEKFRGLKCIRFVVNNDVLLDVWEGLIPPDRLWAEVTYLDNRPAIEANFGIPAEFTLDDLSELPENIDYLSAVRGLWYAHLSGPTLFNVRAGVQILLGLPYAEVESTIEEIRDDFSSAFGRLLLRDVKDTEIVRTYAYPHGLDIDINPATGAAYKVGDTVKQFAPIVSGAYVADWVKDPTWFSGLLNQGSFYEIEKYAKFLVQVESAAFNLSALLFVRQFVLRIKPTYLFPLFIVRADLGEAEVSVSDTVLFHGTLQTWAGPFFGPDGQAAMFDQPRPGGGGFWNQVDVLDPNGSTPVYPAVDRPTEWGLDEYYLAPQSAPLAVLSTVWAGGIPVADSIFYASMPVFTSEAARLFSAGFRRISVAGTPLGGDVTSAITDTLNKAVFFFRGVGDGTVLELKIYKNAVLEHTETFTIPLTDDPAQANQYKFNYDISIAVTTSDVLSATISHGTGFNTFVESAGVVLGVGTDWFSDTALPADTYFTYLVL